MAPHSSTLAWKISWTEKPGGLQSMGSQRVRHDWRDSRQHNLPPYSGIYFTQFLNHEDMVVVVAQLCLTLCGPMDCSPLGFSVHEISQARILGWVAISFSRVSSWPRDRTHVSCIDRQILYHWATREALGVYYCTEIPLEKLYVDLFSFPGTEMGTGETKLSKQAVE